VRTVAARDYMMLEMEDGDISVSDRIRNGASD